MKRHVGLVLVAVVAYATPAWSGVVVTSDVVDFRPKPGKTTAPPSPAPRRGRSFLEGDRLRIEMPEGAMIFRGDRGVVWMLRPSERSYVEVDRQVMGELRDKMKEIRAQLKSQLDKAPPEQRAQMEKMIAAQGLDDASAASPEPDTRRVVPMGKTDKVGGLPCREVEVLRGTEKVSDVCVTDWATAGVTKSDFEVYRKFSIFMREMMAGLVARDVTQSNDLIALSGELDGVPARARAFEHGAPTMEIRILKIEREPVDAALFEVPPGYAKRSMFGGGSPAAPANRTAPGGASPSAPPRGSAHGASPRSRAAY